MLYRYGTLKNQIRKLRSPQGADYNNFHWQYKKLSKEVKRQIKKSLIKK